MDTTYVAEVSPKLRGGLYVKDVASNSPAFRAGLQRGDILVGMHIGENHWETIRTDNILYILRQSQAAHAPAIEYYLVRRKALQHGAFQIAEGPYAAATSR